MKTTIIYSNRQQAGEVLAEKLKAVITDAVVVLSLPRGGTIVGGVIAEIFKAQHDLIISRKIGAPMNAEVAIGALTQDGFLLKNFNIIDALDVPTSHIEDQCEIELKEIKRRLVELRGAKPFPDLTNKTVVIVDDGIATGFTMKAAVLSIRQKNPGAIILTVPVAPTVELEMLSQYVTDIICPHTPEPFIAVGSYYADFSQISDEEVKAVLAVKK